ncbi:MAG: hypothetical protein IKT20_01090 [Clostridiales bacterium]|nr:hypothetical protein [Clostridiales bacterium]
MGKKKASKWRLFDITTFDGDGIVQLLISEIVPEETNEKNEIIRGRRIYYVTSGFSPKNEIKVRFWAPITPELCLTKLGKYGWQNTRDDSDASKRLQRRILMWRPMAKMPEISEENQE